MSTLPGRIPLRLANLYYGWWIVGAGFVITLISTGLFMQAFGAYFVHLNKEFGWNRTVLSGAFALAQIEGGILGPLEGWLIQKWGIRTVARIGAVAFGASLMLMSQVNSILTFYGAFFIAAIGLAFLGGLTVSVVVVNWFEKRRATAMGIATAGFGVSGLIVPLVALALATFGWRATAFASGVLITSIGLICAQVMRTAPEQYGLLPDGATPDSKAKETLALQAAAKAGGHGKERRGPPSFTTRQALRTPAFWLLAFGQGSANIVMTAVILHLIPHLVQRFDMSVQAAAGIVTVVTIMTFITQPVGGILGDKFGSRFIIGFCLMGHMVALLLLATASTIGLVIAFAVVHGTSAGLRSALMASIRAEYFGRNSFGIVFGFSRLIVVIMGVTGPLFAGITADRLGSYQLAFVAMAFVVGFGSILFLLARKPLQPAPAPTVVAAAAAPAV